MLVTESMPERFAARLYHFGAAPREFSAEMLLLRPGRYRATLSEVQAGRRISSAPLMVGAGSRSFSVTLPPAIEVAVHIEPAGGLCT